MPGKGAGVFVLGTGRVLTEKATAQAAAGRGNGLTASVDLSQSEKGVVC